MLNELAKEIHANAVEHGWWEEERSFGDIVALCHTELSEALEEYRAGRPMEYKPCGIDHIVCNKEGCVFVSADGNCNYMKDKPEGIAVEMADCIIRILDWCGKEGVDIDKIMEEKMEYNLTRPYRHGGKRL